MGGGWQVNFRDLLLECARVLYEILLVPFLMYGNETMLQTEERSRIRTVQVDILRGLLGIWRMDRFPNARIREFCGVKKNLDERIDEGILRWRGWKVIELPRESI